jgi:tRNA pseudouridine55 synthase
MSRARKGEIVDVEARPVSCHALELISVETEPEPVATLRVHCGKGYYVRSMARDLGAALGLPAHLAGLRRIRVGPFDIEAAVPPDRASPEHVIGIPRLLAHWRHVGCDAARTIDIRCGRAVPHAALPVVATPSEAPVDRALALDPAGVPLALLRSEGAHWKVERGFMIDIPGCHD